MLHNWRLLETEIADIIRGEGFDLTRDHSGDIVVVNVRELSLSYLAQALTDRGVLAKGNAVRART